jgi:hypothetical protein
MWLWRKMNKISWNEKRANEEVSDIVEEKWVLVDVIVQWKKIGIEHILRGNGLLREVMESKW